MTMSRIFAGYIWIVLILFSETLAGQSPYSVSLIDPELMKNAKAVVRLSDTRLTISSPASATIKVTKVVSVLNESGREESIYFGIDDKFVTFRFNNLVIYDKDGKKLKSFGSLDLKPQITFAGSTLYSDVHYKALDPGCRTYPFTAEISYTIDLKGFFDLPDWIIAEDFNISTEKTMLTVVTPAGYKLKYLEKNLPVNVKVSGEKGKTVYEWIVENDKAREKEPFSPDMEQISPAVFLTPGDFEIAGWKGSTDSWLDYGSFISDLNKDRNLLPSAVTSGIKEMASQTGDTTELVRKLYSMMQEKTRYVSVQIGIGGWQPIEALEVEEKSYGDCKALSNYMKSLLDAAGIKSYYAIIMAGEEAPEILDDFPSNQFNHAIVCVPGSSDTIWLECTSQNIPFDYLGSFTDDRYALLITENGGELRRTRRYGEEENRLLRKAVVSIDGFGNGKASAKTIHSSFFYDEMMPVLMSDYEDQKRSLSESIRIPGMTLLNFKITQPDNTIPAISEEVELAIKGYASVMSDRMILPLNLMNRVPKLPELYTGRNSEVVLRREKSMIDTIVYRLPAGYTVSSSVTPVNLDSPFGTYSTTIDVNASEVMYVRKQTTRKGRFPASAYAALVEYNNKIAAADKVILVLKK
jgi:hypothetical protein